jgi:hypothetical protein
MANKATPAAEQLGVESNSACVQMGQHSHFVLCLQAVAGFLVQEGNI